jgi:HEAT repeat protein
VAEKLQSQIDDLSSNDSAKVAAAAEALAQIGTNAQSAAIALVRACGASDAAARAWAAAALEELGPPATHHIHELCALAASEAAEVAYWAITLLGRAGADAAPAVGVLSQILRQSGELAVRERAAWALGRIGPPAAAAVPLLHAAAAGDKPRLARLAQAALELIVGG